MSRLLILCPAYYSTSHLLRVSLNYDLEYRNKFILPPICRDAISRGVEGTLSLVTKLIVMRNTRVYILFSIADVYVPIVWASQNFLLRSGIVLSQDDVNTYMWSVGGLCLVRVELKMRSQVVASSILNILLCFEAGN